eukprot:2041843-Karenia_brevis.AAC.1
MPVTGATITLRRKHSRACWEPPISRDRPLLRSLSLRKNQNPKRNRSLPRLLLLNLVPLRPMLPSLNAGKNSRTETRRRQPPPTPLVEEVMLLLLQLLRAKAKVKAKGKAKAKARAKARKAKVKVK